MLGIRHTTTYPLVDLFRELSSAHQASWSMSAPSDTLSFDMDARDENGSIVIRADLPGVTKNDLNVTLEKGVLTISAKREIHKKEADGNVYLRECLSGNFSRSLRVPSDINEEDIQATLKDGVLQLILARKEKAKPRKIEIV